MEKKFLYGKETKRTDDDDIPSFFRFRKCISFSGNSTRLENEKMIPLPLSQYAAQL